MKNDLFLKYINGESDFIPFELIPSAKLTIKESLNIYRNGYFGRLTDVLGEHFEACWKILGDDLFLSICNEYILNHPSSEWNINRYGKFFPAMLATHTISEIYPFISNLAELEWDKQNLFHKKDDLGLCPNAITKLNENSKIELVSSLKIATSQFNIPEIFDNAKKDKEFFPENWKTPASWILYKNQNQVYLHKISQATFSLLNNFINGCTLNEALLYFESENESETTEVKNNEIQKLFHCLSTYHLIKKIN